MNINYLSKIAGILAFPPLMKSNIIKLIVNYHKTFLKSKINTFNTSIKPDFTNLPNNYPIDKLNNLNLPNLNIKISFITNEEDTIDYSTKNNQIAINILVNNKGKVLNSSNEINDTIEHELRHFLQKCLGDLFSKNPYQDYRTIKDPAQLKDFLSNVKLEENKIYPDLFYKGFPAEAIESNVNPKYHKEVEKFQNKSTKSKKTKRDETLQDIMYFSDPAEFFPHLANQKNLFNNEFDEVNKENLLEFINNSDFFLSLNIANKKMWERAVKEFWKMLQ